MPDLPLPTIHELRTACRYAYDVTEADFIARRTRSAADARALLCWFYSTLVGLRTSEITQLISLDSSTVTENVRIVRQARESRDRNVLHAIDRAEQFAAALVHVRLGPLPWRKEPPCQPTPPDNTIPHHQAETPTATASAVTAATHAGCATSGPSIAPPAPPPRLKAVRTAPKAGASLP